ncbi:MAG: hypothetical protein Q4G42_03825 [Neisseria sp.]|nr:hypothetical protein [Neisseria sp.]
MKFSPLTRRRNTSARTLLMCCGLGSMLLSGATHAQETVTTTAVSCPAQDFSPFLTAFRNDVQIQRAFTTIPLAYSMLDDEFNPRHFSMQAADFTFPVMASTQSVHAEGIIAEVSVQKDTATVAEQQAGTGRYTVYLFQRQNGCWRLHAIDDQST